MRLRYSIAGMMGLVLFVAVGFAALRAADALWDSALLTLTLGVLGVACLGAALRRGAARATWAGFAAFGVGYLALAAIPWTGPRLLTTRLLDVAYPALHGTTGRWEAIVRRRTAARANAAYIKRIDGTDQTGRFLLGDVVLDGTGGDQASPKAIFRSLRGDRTQEHFRGVGHSLSALTIALIGGLVARRFSDPPHAGTPTTERGEDP